MALLFFILTLAGGGFALALLGMEAFNNQENTIAMINFVVAVLIVLMQTIVTIKDLIKINSKDLNTRENIVLHLGITGTFLGIIIALFHFDFANIDASIPALLEGLKTSFITAVMGLAYYCIVIYKASLVEIAATDNLDLTALQRKQYEILYTIAQNQEKLMAMLVEENREVLSHLNNVPLAIQNTNKAMEEHMQQHVVALEKFATQNVDTLNDELQKILKESGERLAEITQKITEYYKVNEIILHEFKKNN